MIGKGFPKKEHLRGKDRFHALFTRGKRVYLPPLQFLWNILPEGSNPPVQMAVAVSSRKVKKASDRNLIKRQIREAYRVQKGILIEKSMAKQKSLHLVILYVYGRVIPSQDIKDTVYKGLCNISKSI